MAYIKEYWNNRASAAKQSRKHTKEMQIKYDVEIEQAIIDTVLYSHNFKMGYATQCLNNDQRIIIENLDSVGAIFKYFQGKTAVLNFSSYKNPGGMFLEGSTAQEESLCHESFLYNVISAFTDDFYKWNNEHKNKGLYLNRALYSPEVIFLRNGISAKCDVITCAAPNKSAARKYQNVSDSENTKILKDRIRFVLDIACDNKVDTLILGAYGCGVFGQDAFEVASVFNELLITPYHCFKKVIFAIPGKDKKLETFERVMNE